MKKYVLLVVLAFLALSGYDAPATDADVATANDAPVGLDDELYIPPEQRVSVW